MTFMNVRKMGTRKPNCKKLFEHLKSEGLLTLWEMKKRNEDGLRWSEPLVESEFFAVSSETYGKKSELYFSLKGDHRNEDIRKKLCQAVLNFGGSPDYNWGGNGRFRFSLSVTFFKGWHWWE